jgi:all-trans-8'-apo-beta-carotenal 15,15'-oxygenase
MALIGPPHPTPCRNRKQALLKVTLPMVEGKDSASSGTGSINASRAGGSQSTNNVVAFSRRARESASGVAAAPLGNVAGVRSDEWRPGKRCFLQEPMFVPRPDSTAEDDGWIIVGVHNAETQCGEIAILDAQK